MSLTAITEALNAVFERYGDKIIFAYLFGSTVKGEIAPLSDVDVAVYLSDNLKDIFFEIKLSLYADACRALGRNDVDIVVLNTASNLMLIEDIIRNSLVVCEKDADLREDFEVKYLHRAIDFKTHRLAVMGV